MFLNLVTGDFELFKVPVPYGHIWDSFMRVFLGISIWNNYWCSTRIIHGIK